MLSVFHAFLPLNPIHAEDRSRELELSGCDDAILLQVHIEGQPYSFLLDTGSTLTLVDDTFKERLGDTLNIKQKTITPDGTKELAFYEPFDIMLGQLNIKRKLPYLMEDLSFLGKVLGCKFDGVIGMDFLHQHIWDLDFDRPRVSILSDSASIEPDDFDTVVVISPTARALPTIDIKIGDKQIPFVIDTGDTGSGRLTKEVIDYMAEKNLVTDIATDSTANISGVQSKRRVRVKSLEVGSIQYSGLLMTESLQNAIGLGFLNRYHAVLDFPDRSLYLKRGLRVFKRDREDKSGLKLINDNGQLAVGLIDERGPAAATILEKGDIVTEVNNSTVNGSDLSRVRTMLRGEDGTEILLSARRGKKSFEARFKLRRGFDHVAGGTD